MIYLKTEQFNLNGKPVDVEIYEDEFYTMCPACSTETQVEFEDLIAMLNEGLDFSSTAHFCTECSKMKIHEMKVKEATHLKRIK